MTRLSLSSSLISLLAIIITKRIYVQSYQCSYGNSNKRSRNTKKHYRSCILHTPSPLPQRARSGTQAKNSSFRNFPVMDLRSTCRKEDDQRLAHTEFVLLHAMPRACCRSMSRDNDVPSCSIFLADAQNSRTHSFSA